jgi:glycosyltransferase involved in cell wall biosynthesis
VPAVDEPFGRTLVEAMLLGTVVVAAASGGNLEAIRAGETGYLVPPDNATAFADQILRVVRAPELCRAVADAARRDALSRFGLRQHAEAIMRVYDAMLARSAAQSPDHAEASQGAPDPEREARTTAAARKPARAPS